MAGLASCYFLFGFYKDTDAKTFGYEEDWTTHHGRSVSCDGGYEDDAEYEPDAENYSDYYHDEYLEKLIEERQDEMDQWYEQQDY